MSGHRIFKTAFAAVYPLYVQKAERKGRSQDEVDEVICWLTGYARAGLQQQIERKTDFETFFAEAPAMNPNSSLITGVVCGVRVEEVADPLMKRIRQLDKLVDELAKGKALTARGQSPSLAFGHLKTCGFHGSCAPGTSSMRCSRLLVHSLLAKVLRS